MSHESQLVGNAGLYYTCYRLSLLGWNVMPTARNARGIDILAYSADGTRKLAVQVKALSKRNPVPLGASLDHVMGDVWVVVYRVTTEPCEFILFPEEIRQLGRRTEREGRVSYWLEPKSYDSDTFRRAWNRIDTLWGPPNMAFQRTDAPGPETSK